MTIEIKVPGLPESVSDATVGVWHVEPGTSVSRGDNLLDLETDKVVLEVPAPEDGILKEIKKPEGETVVASDVLAMFEPGAVAKKAPKEDVKAAPEKAEKAMPASTSADLSPAVRRMVNEHNLDASQIKASGKGDRITKEDVEAHLKGGSKATSTPPVTTTGERAEKRVPMSRLRQRIAERLLESSQGTAMLTTFNEVDMKAVMDLRKKYKDMFLKTHGVKLGFMSFFTKAVVEALKRYPDVNASIDGKDLVYHGYFDVGVAVSTERGLVVPVIRDADASNMAGVEEKILDYATRARDGKLSLDEITGGTFTITNGGVFGSMLSTPIINPPQSAILGLHNIIERPMVVNGEIVIRPMMYLALSYDHRIIDGKTSVTFLKAIKDLIEDPERLLLEI